jgi:hypothetical protein
MKICPVETELFHVDGRTDRQTDRHDEANHLKILRSAHTVHLRVLYGCEHKPQSFPYTAVTEWFL